MEYPEVADLVPHAGSMLLVRRVLAHSGERTVCEVDASDSELFAAADGRVPAWVGLEYMAQCVAVHGGLRAREAGEGPRVGMLLGTRRLRLHVDFFVPGEVVRVSATRVHASAQMLSFACEIHDGDGDRLLAAARLNVFVSERIGEANP